MAPLVRLHVCSLERRQGGARLRLGRAPGRMSQAARSERAGDASGQSEANLARSSLRGGSAIRAPRTISRSPPPSATLTDQGQDTIAGRLDELKRLNGQVDPGAPEVLQRLDHRFGAPKMRMDIRDRLLIVPVPLDLRIEKRRDGLPERSQFAPTEGVEGVEGVAHDLDGRLGLSPAQYLARAGTTCVSGARAGQPKAIDR
jgi:hypothetical protein